MLSSAPACSVKILMWPKDSKKKGELNFYFSFEIYKTYSSLTLVLAFCEGSHNSPRNKFSSFFTLDIDPHTPRHQAFVKKNFKDFLWKIYERKMENLWKTCHPFFEFIGFMVFKMAVFISRLTSFLQFEKQCVERDIYNFSCFFI